VGLSNLNTNGGGIQNLNLDPNPLGLTRGTYEVGYSKVRGGGRRSKREQMA